MFADNLRAIRYTLEQAWKIARRLTSKLEFLGIQDTARKRRTYNGLWSRGKYGTETQTITKTVTINKW